MPRCPAPGFRLEAEKGLGEIHFSGKYSPGRKCQEPHHWVIRGCQVLCTCAWRSMSFSCVLKVKKPFRSWVTHLLGPQKGNPTLPCFCKYHTSLRSQQRRLWYDISLLSESALLCALSFPMNAAVNPNRNAHAQRDFPVVQTLAGQVSAALAWFHG